LPWCCWQELWIALEALSRASDESLLEFGTLSLRVLDDLGSRADDSCFSYVYGTPATQARVARDVLSKTWAPEFLAVSALVVESALKNPAIPSAGAAAQELLDPLLVRLAEKHGEGFLNTLKTLENPSGPLISHSEVCFALRELFREALALPSPTRASVLRALFSSYS
jgi:hypothetical protein